MNSLATMSMEEFKRMLKIGSSQYQGRDTNIEDPNIDTVLSIGVMGSGKSTLSNIVALRDD